MVSKETRQKNVKNIEEPAARTSSRRIDYRIFDQYDDLTKSEKSLADAVLEREGTFSSYSAAELARLAQVSKATAVRFFRRLGYKNYEEARNEARETPNWGSPLYDDSRLTKERNGSPADDLHGHFFQDIENLTQSLSWLDRSEIDAAVTKLGRGKKIWIIGFRNNFALAQYMRGVLLNIRKNICVFPSQGFDVAEDMASITSSDTVLVIGFRRRPTVLRKIMKSLRKRKVPIILLTDKTASETAAYADVVLRCQNRGSGMFDSYVAGFCLLNYLVTRTASLLGDKSRAHVQTLENLHEQLHDFDK